ncbi:hypothetical protein [Arthrobacter sp. NPDC090010]|uniref:hypothetical protein n=1 Tax=Arthrobacter sp. NPDC090010 TaxID=3363942 RepID=UPI003827A15F
MFKPSIAIGDSIRISEQLVIGPHDYTDRTGTVDQERFDVRGVTLHVEFPGTGLPGDWFHPDELSLTESDGPARRSRRGRRRELESS